VKKEALDAAMTLPVIHFSLGLQNRL